MSLKAAQSWLHVGSDIIYMPALLCFLPLLNLLLFALGVLLRGA